MEMHAEQILAIRIIELLGLPLSRVAYSVISRSPLKNSGDSIHNKIVFRISTESSTLFAKCFRLLSADSNKKLNLQIEFAERLREQGINTPKYSRLGSSYVFLFQLNEITWGVVIETPVDGHSFCFSDRTVNQITELLAICHAISEDRGFQLPYQSEWYNFETKNEIMRYDKFLSIPFEALPKDLGVTASRIVNEGRILLNSANSTAENVIHAAVHGDFSEGNLLIGQGGLGLIDFDQAGNCCLISDLVLHAVHWSESINSNESEIEQTVFSCIKTYCSIRRITGLEERLIFQLYILSRAFYFKRVDKLLSLIKDGDNQHLQETNTVLAEIEHLLLSRSTFAD